MVPPRATDTAPSRDGRLPWWRRWRSALLAAFVAIIAVQAVGEAVDIHRSYARAEAAALTRHLELAQALAEAVDLFVGRYTTLAETAVGPLLGVRQAAGSRRAYLERLARQHPEVGGVVVTDAAGRVVDAADPALLGIDLSRREYFRRVKDGPDVVVSDLIQGHVSGRPSTAIASTARDASGRFLGLLVIGLPTERLAERLSVHLTGGAYPVVLDRAGRAVIHGARPHLDWEGRDLGWLPLAAEARRDGLASGTALEDRVTGEAVLGAMASVPRLGWVVGVLQPRGEALAPAYARARQGLAVTGTLVAASLVLAFLLSRWLSRPLGALADGVSALARGDLAHRVAVRRGDEFGLLAERFNDMAARTEATVGALRDAQARLTLALEAGRMGAWDWDVERGTVAWSPTLEAIHGLPPGGFPGTFEAFRSEIHPEDRERVLGSVGRAVEAGTDHDVEYRIVRPDGEVRWVAARGRALIDDRGRIASMSGICMDVTERKRTEEALRRTTSLLEAVVQASPLAIIALDTAGRITLWNAAAERIYGASAPDVIGRDFPVRGTAQEEEVRANVRRVLEGEVLSGVETRRRTATGAWLDLRIWAAPLTDPEGGVQGALGIVADVTAEKRAREGQRLLAEAGAVLASTLDYEPTLDAVARLAVPRFADACLLDLLDGEALVCSVALHAGAAATELLREARRRFPPDRSGEHPVAVALRTGRTQLAAEVDAAVLDRMSGSPEHRDLLVRLGVRSVVVVPLVARARALGTLELAMTGGDRRFAPADVPVIEEFAARAALAIENARLYREAQEAVRVREAFLARAAHELRTPLTSALGTVRWLARAQRSELRESPRELLDIANRNLGAMMALVNDLLDASKLASGAESLNLSEVEVRELGRRSLDVVRPQARARGVRLAAEVPAGLVVAADALKLEQVLVNLLANAVTFTPAGGRVVLEAAAADPDVLIRVRDTGEGIRPEHLTLIFEPFVQAKRPRDRRRRGTGLGLTICRQIVALHGGRIWAESAGEGMGSVFTVALPARRGEAAPLPGACTGGRETA